MNFARSPSALPKYASRLLLLGRRVLITIENRSFGSLGPEELKTVVDRFGDLAVSEFNSTESPGLQTKRFCDRLRIDGLPAAFGANEPVNFKNPDEIDLDGDS